MSLVGEFSGEPPPPWKKLLKSSLGRGAAAAATGLLAGSASALLEDEAAGAVAVGMDPKAVGAAPPVLPLEGAGWAGEADLAFLPLAESFRFRFPNAMLTSAADEMHVSIPSISRSNHAQRSSRSWAKKKRPDSFRLVGLTLLGGETLACDRGCEWLCHSGRLPAMLLLLLLLLLLTAASSRRDWCGGA